MDPPRARSWTLGRLAAGLLAVATISGVVLIPFYRPEAPLDSLESITGGIPWGWWWRSIHFWSAHAFLVVSLAHAIEVLIRRTETRLPVSIWWTTVFSVPVLIAAMLGGFVMRGDADATQAGSIWTALLNAFPHFGTELTAFFLGTDQSLTTVVTLHHVSTFPLALWLITALHAGPQWIEARPVVIAALFSLSIAAILPPGLGPADLDPSRTVAGPWYFLGLQAALSVLPPSAAILFPVTAFLSAGVARHAIGNVRLAMLAVAGLMLVAWLFWTVWFLISTGAS